MKKRTGKFFFSIVFLTVFFLKMVLSVAPLIVAHFDKQAVNAVIMQLEIENHAKPGEVKDSSIKEYLTLIHFRLTQMSPTLLVLPSMISVDHDVHVQAFYPSVPTPPPNV
jgi:hypothetical protein